MQCPSCSKEIPDGSTFCLHCGTATAEEVAVGAPAEWEYQDFVYPFDPGETWMRLATPEGLVAARLFFWQESQSDIMANISRWQDDGWQPVGELGPSGIKTREFKSFYRGAGIFLGCFGTLLAICTFGLMIPFMRSHYTEPTEFRVTMRRRTSRNR